MRVNVMLDDGVSTPKHAKPGDAGLDLTSRAETFQISPDETVLVGTGVRIEIPDGFYGAVVPRSGIASKRGLSPVNAPGTIDSGYRGEILVPLHKYSDRVQVVEKGERICQLIVMRHETVECVPVSELSDSERSDTGFGSSGAK